MVFLFLVPIPATAVFAAGAGGYNTYRGQPFETYEEIRSLEKTLVKDGYFKLTSDNWGILKNSEFKYEDYLSSWFYGKMKTYVYVDERDYYDWLKTEDLTALTANSVVVGYPSKYRDYSWYTNSDIPSDMTSGYMTIRSDMKDAEYIRISFKESNRTGLFSVFLSKKKNGETVIKLPTGNYQIREAVVADKDGNILSSAVYPESYSTYGIDVIQNENVLFYVGVDTKVEDLPLPSFAENGEKALSVTDADITDNSDINVQLTGTSLLLSDYDTEKNEPDIDLTYEETVIDSPKPSKAVVFIGIFTIAAIIGTVIFLFIRKYENINSQY